MPNPHRGHDDAGSEGDREWRPSLHLFRSDYGRAPPPRQSHAYGKGDVWYNNTAAHLACLVTDEEQAKGRKSDGAVRMWVDDRWGAMTTACAEQKGRMKGKHPSPPLPTDKGGKGKISSDGEGMGLLPLDSNKGVPRPDGYTDKGVHGKGKDHATEYNMAKKGGGKHEPPEGHGKGKGHDKSSSYAKGKGYDKGPNPKGGYSDVAYSKGKNATHKSEKKRLKDSRRPGRDERARLFRERCAVLGVSDEQAEAMAELHRQDPNRAQSAVINRLAAEMTKRQREAACQDKQPPAKAARTPPGEHDAIDAMPFEPPIPSENSEWDAAEPPMPSENTEWDAAKITASSHGASGSAEAPPPSKQAEEPEEDMSHLYISVVGETW